MAARWEPVAAEDSRVAARKGTCSCCTERLYGRVCAMSVTPWVHLLNPYPAMLSSAGPYPLSLVVRQTGRLPTAMRYAHLPLARSDCCVPPHTHASRPLRADNSVAGDSRQFADNAHRAASTTHSQPQSGPPERRRHPGNETAHPRQMQPLTTGAHPPPKPAWKHCQRVTSPG
jgi:hypothetical protein